MKCSIDIMWNVYHKPPIKYNQCDFHTRSMTDDIWMLTMAKWQAQTKDTVEMRKAERNQNNEDYSLETLHVIQ